MNLFYTTNIKNGYAYLEDEEARHCAQVLRKKAGDAIQLVDGDGGWYEGIISEAGKREVVVKIVTTRTHGPARDFKLHIGIAPTKNMDRFEWFLEKATEIGIDAITPIICDHSERNRIRPERLDKILLAAMKQSLKARLPVLNEVVDFESFINQPSNDGVESRFIAHCHSDQLPHLKNNCEQGKDVIALIGPEGDFSNREVELATSRGFTGVSLGPSRLRTETAGIVACHLVNLINDQ